MAEALAVVGVVTSIVQLVDFSTRVVSRLDEFYSVAKEVPKSFRHVKTELPLLTTTLEQLKAAIDTTPVADSSKKALLPVIAGCTEQVEQLDIILKKTIPETNDSWGRKGKKAVASLHHDAKVESITKALRNYVGILTFYYAAASSTLQPLTDAKLCKIRQWLSAPDPSTNYQKALKLRQADTGIWFLESDTYTRWKTAAASPLWLYGIPGCGKTILSSTVLENIFQNCQDDPAKAIAYFFFDFNDVQKQDPEMMIRSLVCQLSQQCIKIPASLDALFSSSESGQRQPPAHALMEALRSMVQGLPIVYVVLDALDECTQREELMEMLEAITGWQLPNLHFMVTSRRERDIEMSLESFIDERCRICLQSTLVDKDIKRYVRQRLSDDKRLRKWEKDASMMRQIETALMSGAKGMFRWAVCQLDALGKCVNRKMLQQALATLPPTLDQTYDRILASIDNDYSQYALRILQWLTFSAKPLSVDEVAEVIAIDVKREPVFDCDEVLEDSLEILNICSSLVTIATENDDGWRKPREVVVLAHYSVKEYLVSERIWKGKAAVYGMRDNVCHDAIATGCLGYLLQFQQSKLEPDFLKLFKLARYSAEFWASHVQKGGDAMKETSQKAMQLCSKENYAYANWIRLWDPDRPWEKPKLEKTSNDIPNPLYYAALLDLRNLLKMLLEKDADVNAQGGYYGNALQAASYRGHEAVDGQYGNALYAASSEGHEAVVRMLLDKDADVNAQGGHYGSALLAASSGGHKAVAKMLLDKGAEAASSGGHEVVVEMLLDKGAEVNAQGGQYGNALYAASSGAVMKVLKARGAK
ncbi:ankyrin [Periconia macrospinosa]|uniref:Ankyrin n=1 Tax=Periconia macrospinosa TaxID=97972 RepID=A0A2V1D1C9_9PLEO|nr:ankyrin [Periconia macrospinosa]